MALRIRKKLFHHIFCGHPVEYGISGTRDLTEKYRFTGDLVKMREKFD